MFRIFCKWVRGKWHVFRVRRIAENDAGRSDARPDPDTAVIAVIGPRPELDPFDPAIEYTTETIAEAKLEQHTRKASMQRAEDALIKYPSRNALRCGLAALCGGESVGTALLLRDVGVDAPDRYVLAPLGATFLFLFVGLVVKYGIQTDRDGHQHRRWWVPILYATFVIVIAGIAVARFSALSVGDGSFWSDLATSVVMMITVLGPSALAEHLLVRLRDVAPLQKEAHKERLRFTEARVTESAARARLETDAKARRAYDVETASLKAEYLIKYRNCGGPVPPGWSPLAKDVPPVVVEARAQNTVFSSQVVPGLPEVYQVATQRTVTVGKTNGVAQ